MIAKDKERITITLPKTLIKRMKKICKYNNTQISKYIQKEIEKVIKNRELEIKYSKLTDEEKEYIHGNLEETIRILKTPWLDDEEK